MYDVKLNSARVNEYLMDKLGIVLSSKTEKGRNFTDSNGYIEDEEWRKLLGSEFRVYLPDSTAFDNTYRYVAASNMLCSLSIPGGKKEAHNCATFVVDFISSCEFKFPLNRFHLIYLIGLNVIASAVAGFNSVTAYMLLRLFNYMKNGGEFIWAKPAEGLLTGTLGVISLSLVIAQATFFVTKVFLVPCLRRFNLLDSVDDCCNILTLNSPLRTSIIFLTLQLIIFALNLMAEEKYFDNFMGVAAGAGAGVVLFSWPILCACFTLSDIVYDDVNYILKPDGVGRILRSAFFKKPKQSSDALHKKFDDIAEATTEGNQLSMA